MCRWIARRFTIIGKSKHEGERMKQKDKFRYAEKCLYEYKRNMACIEILKEDLRVERAGSDVHVQNYQYTFNFTGEPSNPVQARLIKIEQIEERIRKLERCTKPITQLVKDLTSAESLDTSHNKELYEVMKLMYFGNNQPDAIIEELRVAKRTFARRRRELVLTAISYLAL